MADSVPTELLPLTEMVSKMFTPEFVEFIKKEYGGVRNFYETSTAITQCNNTIRPVVPNQSKCWICGYGIPLKSNPLYGFAPECEHIFPIAQALFFIGLYTSDVKDNPAYVDKLKLEYEWSHRVCNQIKNDAHFIEYDIKNPKGRWQVNTDKIKAFLNDILKRGNKYGRGADLLKLQIRKDGISTDTWIGRQTPLIYQKCIAIISQIPRKNENFWILATVSDLALAYQNSGFEPEIIEPYVPIAQSGRVAVLNHTEIVRIYSVWSKYIMDNVHMFMVAYLAERPPRRLTPDEKAQRSQKALALLDESLIRKASTDLVTVYYSLPNDANKGVRFIEAILYVIESILLERMTRIFTDAADKDSQSLNNLGSELRRNIQASMTAWQTNGLQNGLDQLNLFLSRDLKGASRKRK